MIISALGYSYNDLTIIPAELSHVKTRSRCEVHYDDGMLPIFASPMASVISDKNYKIFQENKINTIIPRNISIDIRKDLMEQGEWVALSLKEFEDLFIDNFEQRKGIVNKPYKICIDIANGHMKYLYDLCIEAKKLAHNNYKLIIMTGNIANPDTYRWISEYNVNFYETYGYLMIDYIRCSIGTGSMCITSSNTSVHMPIASLIDGCYNIKKSMQQEYWETLIKEQKTNSNNTEEILENSLKPLPDVFPKIIADGGIRNYSDVIKALALGADYVMIGGLFAQCMESAGEKIYKNPTMKGVGLRFPIERYKDLSVDYNTEIWSGYYTDAFIGESIEPWKDDIEKLTQKSIELQEKKNIGTISVKVFGMASADGQKSISGQKTKTAEGITKYIPVKYTLKGWVENMESYLKSAMSYTDHTEIKRFIGQPTLMVNSMSEIQAVNK